MSFIEASSFIEFGTYDNTYTEDALIFLSNEFSNVWGFNITSFQVAGTYETSANILGYLTSTVYTYLPNATMHALIANLRSFNCNFSSSEITCACDMSMTTLPNIYFTLSDSATIELTKDMIYERVNGVCYVNVLTRTNITMAYLGYSFYKNNYLIFDASNNRIAFGQTYQGSISSPTNTSTNPLPLPIPSNSSDLSSNNSSTSSSFTEADRSAAHVILAIVGFLCLLVCVVGGLALLLGVSIGMILKMR